MAPRTVDEKILEIVKRKFFNIPTLDERGRDALDFHDIHVSTLKEALKEAYHTGFDDACFEEFETSM